MKNLFTLSLLFISIFCFGQLKTVPISALDSLQQIDPKPVYLFAHTDWCKFCLMMEETTLKNKKIISLLNDQFYTVFFNPEKEIAPENLSVYLATKKVYPSSIFLSPDLRLLTKKEGLLKKEALYELLINCIVN